MKKIKLLIVALAMAIPFNAIADEGMWLLQLLDQMNIKEMRKAGCKLSAQQIYDVNHSSLKDAIVHFGGGCTAEVVSGKGLVFTNHHCGYSSIQQLSSTEHDYLTDGYWAMNTSEELPCPGLQVTFLERFVDVTDAVNAIEEKYKDLEDRAKQEAVREAEQELIKKEIGDNKYLRGRIVSFYQDNIYYMVITKTYTDIRFVGAPPSSVGKFGGETDNWEWPRHTGDFSVFRIYADKDNNPAPYSKDNVPYTPKQFLTVSAKGYKPGDFTMIIGYPGRTQRYLTSEEVVERRDAINTPRVIGRTAKEDVWKAAMRADHKTYIQYANKFAGSSNYRKNSDEMNKAFVRNKTVDGKKAEEQAFVSWVNQNPARVEKYGNVIETINKLVKEREPVYRTIYFFVETVTEVEIISPASAALSVAQDSNIVEKFKQATDDFYKDYSPSLDRATSKALLKTYKENVDKKDLPAVYDIIDERFGGNIDAYVDYMFDNTVFTSQEKAAQALASSEDLSADPAVEYLMGIMPKYQELIAQMRQNSPKINEAKKLYMEGIMEMRKGQAMYPDANSTMRLTYGTVGGYSPRDAVDYKYYTTLEGVMQKEDPENPEFVVPAKLKELYAAKDYGMYANKDGELPVCFLTNSDITGGNSGSGVLNAKGELIGLAFDGNNEAMSGDIIFENKLQKCINVDIRYVLFLIDKLGGAGYLFDEMVIK